MGFNKFFFPALAVLFSGCIDLDGLFDGEDRLYSQEHVTSVSFENNQIKMELDYERLEKIPLDDCPEYDGDQSDWELVAENDKVCVLNTFETEQATIKLNVNTGATISKQTKDTTGNDIPWSYKCSQSLIAFSQEWEVIGFSTLSNPKVITFTSDSEEHEISLPVDFACNETKVIADRIYLAGYYYQSYMKSSGRFFSSRSDYALIRLDENFEVELEYPVDLLCQDSCYLYDMYSIARNIYLIGKYKYDSWWDLPVTRSSIIKVNEAGEIKRVFGSDGIKSFSVQSMPFKD